MSRLDRTVLLLTAVVIVLAACGSDLATTTTSVPEGTAPTTTTAIPADAASTVASPGDGCADVIDVTIEPGDAGYTVSATVASADTGWDKYADLWEIRSLDGTVLGERVLAHPHETEQPFTRSVGGVAIPEEVSEVVVVARDSVAGFCGAEYVAEVPQP